MRILHLIDAASPQVNSSTLALLAASQNRLGQTQQEVVLLGPPSLAEAAGHIGIHGADQLPVPYGRAYLGYSSLRRKWRGRHSQFKGFDVIHCWSVGALSLAKLLFSHTPRLLTVTTMPTPRTSHWLRILTNDSAGRGFLLPISSTLSRALLGGGIDKSAVHVLRPGIDMSWITHDDRVMLRQSWGIDSDNVCVVALLCDPPHVSDAIDAAMAVILADEAYQANKADADTKVRFHLLIHPNQKNRRRAENMMRHISRGKHIIREWRLGRPWQVLSGCDLTLAQGSGGGGLSLLWAMAANVPIVGEATYPISEIVEDRHSALLAKPDQPKALAHRLVQLASDPQLAWKLRDTARHEAYSFFSRQRYCQSLQTVYQQIVEGQSIEVPSMEPTGGLRFAGRV